MKKTILQLVVTSIIISLILLLGINSFSKIKEKNNINKAIQTLQPFCAVNPITDCKFCIDSLLGKPILILFMHPECDSCQEEIKQLKNSSDKFKDIFIVLITSVPTQQAISFYENQKLSQLTNMQFLSDTQDQIASAFDVNIIPSMFLYNKHKKLVYKHAGEIEINILSQYLD